MWQTKQQQRNVALLLACVLAAIFGARSLSVAAPANISTLETVVAKKSKTAKTNYVYQTLQLSNLKDFRPLAVPLDRYGGRTDLKGKATGFFHTEKLGGRWFLIDPEGGAFISVGINAIGLEPPENPAAFRLKYGNKTNWAHAAKQTLETLNVNTLGCWSDSDAFQAAGCRMPYMPRWNLMSHYAYARKAAHKENGSSPYPNDCVPVFDPEFEAFCQKEAAALAATKDDPWLVGHFSDNELPFKKANILKRYLGLPANDAGHQAAQRFLAEKHKQCSAITAEDDGAFCQQVISRYYKLVSNAIRRHDPNHLYLGTRFHGWVLVQDETFTACGPYVDVVSANYYGRWTPDQEELDRWTKLSGKPLLITEWYAKGDDAGLDDREGAGFSVATQTERGMFYENFTLGLLRNKNCVGWHWFRWADDVGKKASNKGVFSGTYEPYPALINAMTRINRSVYSLKDYLDQAQSPNLLNRSETGRPNR